MNEKELEMLRKLQAKQKKEKREEAKFWKTIEDHREEILNKLLADTLQKYGCDVRTFLDYVTSEAVMSNYKRQREMMRNG